MVLKTEQGGGTSWWNSYHKQLHHTSDSGAVSSNQKKKKGKKIRNSRSGQFEKKNCIRKKKLAKKSENVMKCLWTEKSQALP